ncbi:hypothetical protein, partial [Pseudomonas viridiflava]|uniref:hypothetical protein n=1 Tax=Pseudomonas viridiflava TaxID=33069 RepID=UPI0019820794
MSVAEHIVAAIYAAFIAIIVSCIMSMSISMGMSVIDMFFIIAIVSIAGLLVVVIGHGAVRPACPLGVRACRPRFVSRTGRVGGRDPTSAAHHPRWSP